MAIVVVGKKRKKVMVYRILSRYQCRVAKVIGVVERLLKRNDRGAIYRPQRSVADVCVYTSVVANTME